MKRRHLLSWLMTILMLAGVLGSGCLWRQSASEPEQSNVSMVSQAESHEEASTDESMLPEESLPAEESSEQSAEESAAESSVTEESGPAEESLETSESSLIEESSGEESSGSVPSGESHSDSGESSREESRTESRSESRVESSREESSKPESESLPQSDTRYLVRVNKSTNVVTIFEKDGNGNYTIPVRAMICSTGPATPEGVYTMSYQARWNGLIHDQWGQYVSHIIGDYLFHTVPTHWKGEDGVDVAEYNKLGTSCSAGCVRLLTGDAYWMYNNCTAYSTLIQIGFFGADADPLGKPSFVRLPANTTYNWDPTDPAPTNPWNKCKPHLENIPEDFVMTQGDAVPASLSQVRGYDTCGNDITSSVRINGSVNPYQPGVYTITYSVMDALGRSASGSVNVTVEAPPQESSAEESSGEESVPEDSGTEESSVEESVPEESSKEPEHEESTPEETSIEESSQETSAEEQGSGRTEASGMSSEASAQE